MLSIKKILNNYSTTADSDPSLLFLPTSAKLQRKKNNNSEINSKPLKLRFIGDNLSDFQEQDHTAIPAPSGSLSTYDPTFRMSFPKPQPQFMLKPFSHYLQEMLSNLNEYVAPASEINVLNVWFYNMYYSI